MKRSLKNIIIIVLVILMGVSMFITMNYVKNHTSNNNTMPNINNNASYTANTEIKEDTEINSGEYKSSSSDENTILVSKGTSTISNIKSSSEYCSR